MRTFCCLLLLASSLGCSSKGSGVAASPDSPVDSAHTGAPLDSPGPVETVETGDTGTLPAEEEESGPLELSYLGVGGVALRFGEDLILTAPLLSNPDMLTVTLGETVSDPELVESLLPLAEVEGAAAILVGHAHYDHLLDVPKVAEMAGDPVVYGNLSAQNLLAGVLPVVAVDDPADPKVDRRMAGTTEPCSGLGPGLKGDWIDVPGTRVRVRALASVHPDQFLGIAHYGEGCVDEAWDSPPTYAGDWLEGGTLAWLIDFLDEDGAVAYRIYYQDAPTSAPMGDVYPELLAERGVDLALLCVGSYAYVRDAPTEALANLDPRYVVGIHWENFFITQDLPTESIPFEPDQTEFDDRVALALASETDLPVLVEGVEEEGRYWRPDPQTHFSFPLRAEGVGPVVKAPSYGVEANTELVDGALVLRANLPAWASDCEALGEAGAPCEDADLDGLSDAWEDLALAWLRPTLRFDEAEPFVDDDDVLFDVGRVAPAEDGSVRVFVMQGYAEDYGRCGLSAHDGDPERVVLNLELLSGGDAQVVGLYTAAHEGTVTDHSELLEGEELVWAVFVDDAATGAPRWRIFASDGKHASYPTVDLCEDAEVIVCLEEDCDADGVDDEREYDFLPPVINAGELAAPRYSDLSAIGFPEEDAWLDQDFCGGQGRGGTCSASVLEKLVEDPF